jgi:hypothetical protein
VRHLRGGITDLTKQPGRALQAVGVEISPLRICPNRDSLPSRVALFAGLIDATHITDGAGANRRMSRVVACGLSAVMQRRRP